MACKERHQDQRCLQQVAAWLDAVAGNALGRFAVLPPPVPIVLHAGAAISIRIAGLRQQPFAKRLSVRGAWDCSIPLT